jgi:CRP-like cAMP-binding protein
MAETPHTSNHLLASLSAGKMAALLPHLKFVELPQETVLYENGDTIKAVYFPHSGLISLVVDLATGETIETAMIGRDSVAGSSSAFDNKISLNRSVVQVAGTASVLDVGHFSALAEGSDAFRAKLARHEQLILAQAQQSAACNATHSIEARLARWLLRCRDLLGGDDIQLTQEFLAQMMGVRRTSVSIVANTLQKRGLIRYSRGNIRILDVNGLKGFSCECYRTLKSISNRLLGVSAEA